MPPKSCAKCTKTVYPTEELKCLDKIWHKGCFKCQECGMTLNMKNYKGYNKLPYCNAHYPTMKHTVVADTPENRRIAANTKVQSNIKYHEEFETAKGKKMSVANDPETERIKKNMQTISNVAYHGELEKKMEQESHRPSHAVEGQASRGAPPPQQHLVGTVTETVTLPPDGADEPLQGSRPAYAYDQQQHGAITMNQPYRRQPGRINDYDPMSQETVYTSSPYSNQRVGHQVYSSSQASEPEPRTRRVGSIADYDPVNEQYGSVSGQYTAAAPAAPAAAPAAAPVQYRQPSPPPVETQYREPSPPPVEEYRREPSPPPVVEYRQPSPPPPEEPTSPPPAADMFARPNSQPPVAVDDEAQRGGYGGGQRQSRGLVCRAMFDYTAADTDEVSFRDGDRIVNCQVIDEGWMTGTVERSGAHGMLPANYVEQI